MPARSGRFKSPGFRRRRSSSGCGHAGASSPRRSCMPSTKAHASLRTSTRRSKRSTPLLERWRRLRRRGSTQCDSEVHREARRPHRSLVAWQNAPENPFVVIVISEVEEGVAIVGVQPRMPAEFQFRAQARVPSKIADGLLRDRFIASQNLEFPCVPAGAAQEVRRELAPNGIEQERGLNWVLTKARRLELVGFAVDVE